MFLLTNHDYEHNDIITNSYLQDDECDQMMNIAWQQSETKYAYFYGRTGTRFSAQIGESTTTGEFMWLIFHDDFKYAIHGDSAKTIEDAMLAVAHWFEENAKEARLIDSAT